MGVSRGSCRSLGALALALTWIAAGARAEPGASPPPASAPSALVRQGERLFDGRVAFQNGGPACGSCHAIATLPFPNGGTLGPDLSGIVQTLGPEGTTATLQTLFFPTMLPLYQERSLTDQEQAALGAFLAQANGASGRDRDSAVLGALALVGFLVLLSATGLAWRGRLRGVRALLVERVHPRGARP